MGRHARAAPERVVLSVFANPPSGRSRAVMSVVFRALTRHVGGMRVSFAGTVRTYPREQGVSREATLGRIARMFVEIARARV